MKTRILTALTVIALASPAFAAGDAAKGEKMFLRCKACHSIIKDDGTVIVKGGKVGPDLYGVVGRAAATGVISGTDKPFKYGDGIKEAGDKGLVWTEEEIAVYVKNPTKFLKKYTDDSSARSKMAFKLRDHGEDVAAYLASVAQ